MLSLAGQPLCGLWLRVAVKWSVQYSESGSRFNRVDTYKGNGRVARSVFLPGRFSRGWPPAFTLASQTAALRSVTKSWPLVPRTLLSRLREQTSQAKRPAPGPTLAGAEVNSDATVIKCGDSPLASLVVIRALAVKKYAGEELTLVFM